MKWFGYHQVREMSFCTIGLVFIFQLFAGEVYSEENEWNYGEWTTTDGDTMVRYITHGSVIWGHKFGFIKRHGDCNNDILWLSWSTNDEEIEQFEGEKVVFKIGVDGTSFQIRVNMLSVYALLPVTKVMAFTNFLAGPKFIELLEKGKKVTVEIIGPDSLIKHFDFLSDSFSLNGFCDSRLKLQEICRATERILFSGSP